MTRAEIDQTPRFARALSEAIQRKAFGHAVNLDAARIAGGLKAAEPARYEEFEISVRRAVELYKPVVTGDSDATRLVFRDLYDRARDAIVDRRSALLAALMAAQVEAEGPLRLSRSQNEQLARVLRYVGGELRSDKLYRHAESAFHRASQLFQAIEEYDERDECRYAAASAKHGRLTGRRKRLVQTLNKNLVGYGFRPYLLLRWLAVQLVVACLLLLFVVPNDGHESTMKTVYIVLQDFINPMGVGDIGHLNGIAWTILVTESYLGAVSQSVFFALLLQKWFRS